MRIESENLATAAVTIATYACRLTRVQGFFNGSTANRWLQLHNTKTTPANAAVPLRSWPIYQTAPFDQNFQNDAIELTTGMTLVVSSTQATYTASADTVDVYVNGYSDFDPTGTSVVGDYTTAVQELNVTNSGTPKKLLRIEVTSLSDAGAVTYLKVYATSSINVGDKPIMEFPLARATNYDLWLNVDLVQFILNTRYDGVYLVLDATPNGLVGDYAGTDFAIKATIR